MGGVAAHSHQCRERIRALMEADEQDRGIVENAEQRKEAEARARKAKAATKHDRLEFVQNLVRQIEEYADTPREVSASLTGDDGTVLLFKGDLERHEGDKLVAALRSELLEHGFTRVEGEGPKGKWWSRV